MKVIDALLKKEQTLSFEFFPPKSEKQEENLFRVFGDLKKFNPDFVSITCGALGSTHDKTIQWTKVIKEKVNLEPVTHLTCVSTCRRELEEKVCELKSVGVENILALRGDRPVGTNKFVPPLNGFRYAKDMVAFLKEKFPEICVGVAGYPEGHREAESIGIDTEYLKQKIDAGAEYIITQLFFEAEMFFRFQKRCEKAGISVPIVPGIIQITSIKQITKITEICGATIPKYILDKLEQYDKDQKAVEEYGVEQAALLCQKLKTSNIPGFHFFVMNKSEPISKVLKIMLR